MAVPVIVTDIALGYNWIREPALPARRAVSRRDANDANRQYTPCSPSVVLGLVAGSWCFLQ